MKRSRAQIKAELLKRFEQEVDELLDWQERSQAPNLSQFEDEILATRKEISIALLEELLQGEEQREPVEAPRKQRQATAGDRNTRGNAPTGTGILLLLALPGGRFSPWIGS